MIELGVIDYSADLRFSRLDTSNAHPPQTSPDDLLPIHSRAELAQQKDHPDLGHVPALA